MQSVTILGSTGSIGVSTLDVIARYPDKFKVEALTANKNIKLLYQQCVKFNPKYAAVLDDDLAFELKSRFAADNINTEVVAGSNAFCELAANTSSDTVVSAIVGAAGLLPTMSAIKASKRVLLANKESLVMGGDLFMQAVGNHNATLLPVDSEHNAIFQCLPDDFLPGRSKLAGIHSIILTASGGPFRNMPKESMSEVTPVQAIAHPNWQMGSKISVDSATMMNKGLEVIEAYFLFGLDLTQLRVVVHPQSIIHSLVEYADGSLLAQLGPPDMRVPITNALAWPKRIASGAKRLDLTEISRLDFETPDVKRFPCLRLAYQAIKSGGTAMTVLNAANEVAVEAFCNGQIKFTDIPVIIDRVMQDVEVVAARDLEVLVSYDNLAREKSKEMIFP